jgi:hypothetical protein
MMPYCCGGVRHRVAGSVAIGHQRNIKPSAKLSPASRVHSELGLKASDDDPAYVQVLQGLFKVSFPEPV